MDMKSFLLSLFHEYILYNELYLLDEGIALANQVNNLKEDLLQVESKDKKYILDVGWYPEFDISGYFTVMIIRKYDWEDPVFIKKCYDLHSLKQTLLECKSKM